MQLENIGPWLIEYKYFILFPLSVLEGPFTTVIAGFFSSLGYLSLWIAYGVVVAGDVIGDSIYYSVGKYGRMTLIKKYGNFIGVTQERLEKLESFFLNNSSKTLIFGKFVHGTGSIMWVAAGMAKMPYKIFILTNFCTTAIKSFILLMVGYYFGSSYKSLGNYFDYLGLLLAVLFIGIYLLATKTTIFDNWFKKIKL